MIWLPSRRISIADQRRVGRHLTVIVIVIAVAVMALLLAPPTTSDLYAPCPWFFVTGTFCPGCGSLRGMSGLLGGDVLALPRNNLFAAIALPFFGYALLNLASQAIFRHQLPQLLLTRREILVLAASILAFGVIRNMIGALAPISF